MNKFYLLTFFTFFFTNVHSQEYIFQTKQKGKIIEEYYTIKGSDKKNGAYIKYELITGVFTEGIIKLIETGNYKNDQKDGKWLVFFNANNFYGRNLIASTLEYKEGKKNGAFMQFYIDTTRNIINTQFKDSKLVPINLDIDFKKYKIKMLGLFENDKRTGEWIVFDDHANEIERYDYSNSKFISDSGSNTLNAANRKAIYLGGDQSFNSSFFDFINSVDLENPNDFDSTFVQLSFNIDTLGVIHKVKVEESNSNINTEKKLQHFMMRTSENWIPAFVDNTKINSRGYLYFYFIREPNYFQNKFQVRKKIRYTLDILPPTAPKLKGRL